MYIEVVFEFDSDPALEEGHDYEPEENQDNEDDASDEETEGHLDGVPDFFDHMVVNDPGKTPYARIRLQSMWKKDLINPEGSNRNKISLHYVP